jgi:hypothetical protein
VGAVQEDVLRKIIKEESSNVVAPLLKRLYRVEKMVDEDEKGARCDSKCMHEMRTIVDFMCRLFSMVLDL